MVDHMHKAGEFMVGYRYSLMPQKGGMRFGKSEVADIHIPDSACGPGDHAACAMKPVEMTMQMHMLDIMYAPTDWLTLMVMPQWMSMDMTMSPLQRPMHGGHGGHDHHGEHDDHGHGGHMGTHSHGTDGIGDTQLAALFRISQGPGYSLHGTLGLSAPTGSIEERGRNGLVTHYMMQLGSGTWDLLPSLTYTGHVDRFAWGLQVGGIKRLEDENERGWRYGDVFQTTAWASYRILDWVSASVRLAHMQQGIIEGHWNVPHNHSSPPDYQPNYGGNFWDIGFGVNMVVPDGFLEGHRLAVEWIEPIRDEPNGYQLERDGTLYLNWSKAF